MKPKPNSHMPFLALSLLFAFAALFASGCVAEKRGGSSFQSQAAQEDRGIGRIQKMRDQAVSTRVGRWAVVVGISDYQYDSMWDPGRGIPDLQFAHKDAESFARFLLSPAGGAFPPDKVVLLTDGRATVKEVRKAVGDFLARSLEDDLVIFYFAGHGAADPRNPDNLYLLCHDTEPGNFYGTAFPMWEIDTAISRTIRSEKVVVLTDACHSAGVGLRGNENASRFNAYMAKLADSKQGITKITASRADQLSQERVFPGIGGHGVFTYYLLEGLNGRADDNRDGFVTMKEAYDYLYDRVRSDTRHSQNPWASPYVSDDIPMGVVDRQVLAAIEARTQQGGAIPSPVPSSAPAPLPSISVHAPADSGVALKLAQHKLDNNDPSSALSLAESVLKRQDPHEPDALAMKVRILLSRNDLARAVDAEDLLVIQYPDHPSAQKAADQIYDHYMKQVEDAPPKQQIEQLEKYLARHKNGLARPKAEAELAAIQADIRGRYERLYDKQLVLAKGFMDQNRFDRSKEALDKAKSIADEALREQGVALDVAAIDDLRSKAGSLEVQAGQKAAFEQARQKASRQKAEEQVRTWQDFIANNPGNPHNDDAQKTLAQLRSSLKNRMQSRFDKLLRDAERALSSRDYAACLAKIDEASRIRTHASDQLGIELNQGSLASLRSRHQTEAEKHRDYLAWQKASEEAASVSPIANTPTASFSIPAPGWNGMSGRIKERTGMRPKNG